MSPYPTPEQFVVAWSQSSSLNEVASRLRQGGFWMMGDTEVAFWGAQLRSSGVRLRPLNLLRPSRLGTAHDVADS